MGALPFNQIPQQPQDESISHPGGYGGKRRTLPCIDPGGKRTAGFRRFFAGPALRWAGSEVPVEQGGQLLRIDRLVALADGEATTWWVLDYKLQSAPEAVPAYRAQMRRYMAAVQALQPADAVRGAFITGGGALVEI